MEGKRGGRWSCSAKKQRETKCESVRVLKLATEHCTAPCGRAQVAGSRSARGGLTQKKLELARSSAPEARGRGFFAAAPSRTTDHAQHRRPARCGVPRTPQQRARWVAGRRRFRARVRSPGGERSEAELARRRFCSPAASYAHVSRVTLCKGPKSREKHESKTSSVAFIHGLASDWP